MRTVQTASFKKAYKKLYANQLPEVNAAIKAIMKNPKTGEQKHGDLSWLRVYKFKMIGQLMLLGYAIDEVNPPADNDFELTLVALGPHENFYRDLKKR